ncbi:MAG TPA: hypothetical protein VGW40_09855 [Allosphingosinicella sp.]|nr:hypothetical protein [Allosphingosinicella sp.]
MIVGRTLMPRLACAATLLAAALPASAQYGSAPPPAPPPPIPRGDSGQSAAAAPAAPATPAQLHGGAACLIARNANAADALLATGPYSAAERQQAVRLLGEMQRCTRPRQTFTSSAVAIRGALAEAVYEARFTAPAAARSPALAARPLLQPSEVASGTDAAALGVGYALAECTAAQHPELVIAFLQTEPASPAAQAALQALNPAFVACVVPGTQISLDGRTIRGILAEDLYRWSVVQRDGPTSPLAAAPAPATTAAAH